MRVPGGTIETYKQSVSLGAMPDARVQAGLAGSPEAHGAAMGQAMEGMSGALAKAASVADKMQEDKIASDVVVAQTEYQKRLSDALYSGENALLSRSGENADKIDSEYRDIEKKIRDETIAKLPNFELAHKAFARLADREDQNSFELINRHKMTEGEKTFKQNLTNAINTAIETTSRNYNNLVAIQQGIEQIAMYSNTFATKEGGAAAKALQHDSVSSLLNATLGAAFAKEDFKSMEAVLEAHRDKLSPDVANKWTAAVTEKRAKNEKLSTLDSLKNNPAFKDANGFFDPQKAMNHIRGLTKKTTISGGSPGSYEDFRSAIFGQETGGNFDAPSNKFGTIGIAQMLPSTYKSGLRAAGLPEDSPPTPENQMAAIDALLKPLYQKYGAKGAAVAWYAGEQNAPRFLNGQPLIGDNGGEYSADAKQDDGYGNKTAPSVREYSEQVAGRMGGGGKTEIKEEPMYDAESLAWFEKQFQVLHAADIQRDNEQQHFAVRNVQDWLATNKNLPLDQKVAFVKASGLRPAQAETLTSGMIREAQTEEKVRITEISKIAEGTLEVLDAKDALTVSSVDALKGQLASDKYLHYLAKATRAEKSAGEKVNSSVDKGWHEIIKNDKTFGNNDQQNALIGSITELLNVEHTEGPDRQVKASKFIEEARNKSKREYIAGYSSRNNQAFLQMEELFPGASTLVRKSDPNVDGYEWIDILKRLSSQTYENPYAAKAWNTIFNNRLPLTESSFAELTEFYRKEAEGGN